ncbi:MAG: asparagine synthase (glutamine-hydrolyzing) [Bacteroidetes bacterium]|nr:asparagine synthase (glutamine-hydrolyzing) [Bacteroidota bacterium]
MCGICGIINFIQTPVEENSIRQMKRALKHRGPDDDGLFIENNVGFGYVRLSIIDLSAKGHQPMEDESGRYVMIFNGEIYNYIELKEELKGNYSFKTNTDSEVLLASYIFWGEDCLHHFNGMFSFVIYDKETKSIFAARDRFGVKPFYYYADDEQFIFASELQAILKVLKKKPEQNNQTIYDFLVFNRTDQTEATFFKNIKKLQHGSKMKINHSNEYKIEKWYHLNENINNPFTNDEEYKELFSSAIGLRLRCDVPIGVCLSGGLDSSAIVSTIIKDFDRKDINTFSAVYGKGNKGDESEYIDEYKGLLKNMHYTYPSGESLFDDLDSFITTHAEPIPDTSPYAQYKLMELAKDHVTVLLDGQGADEQLGGYHYFFGFYYKELFKQLKWLLLLNEIFAYYKKHHSTFALQTFGYFLLPDSIKTKLKNGNKGYLNNDFSYKYASSNNIVKNIYDSKDLKSSLLDHFEYKLEHLLKWEDCNSMKFGLESRVPFLDYRLVEKTLALPSNQIIRNGTTKFIFREAMKGILPERIRNRQSKIGFGTPEDIWFRMPKWQSYIEEILNSSTFKARGYIDHEVAIKKFKIHQSGKANLANEIWKWIHLELWFRKYID